MDPDIKTANMDFFYKKNDNTLLFKSVQDVNIGMNLKDPQNYIPIYESFFSLTSKNYNDINLNHTHTLLEVKDKKSYNVFSCCLSDGTEKKIADVFFKYSPLLDPSKYLIGKYDITDTELLCLPSFIHTKGHAKNQDPNNAAYVDGFFTYLTSQLLHTHKFIHAIDFYGSFVATKERFEYNMIDDVEYINESDFFHKHNNILFTCENDIANHIFNFNTRRNKESLIYESHAYPLPDNIIDTLEDGLHSLFSEKTNIGDPPNTELDLIYHTELSKKNGSTSSSECSSNSCTSTAGDEDTQSMSNSEESSEGYSTVSDDVMNVTITNFPVNVIALERCCDTLDAYVSEHIDHITDEEWGSIILQIVMMLFTYQKTYGLTHNDLHTNNIMYTETDVSHIYYKAMGQEYKVPTFGKIYKIIDFGRAIYKFRGNIVCSDSYHPKGDAANLYNFEPYFNDKKPRLEPNFSFDLCRLGCSLIDFFIHDPTSKDSPAKKIIMDWCLDDKGRNVLYKTNGEERYPDFKLYKMIARTVHNSTPESQLNHKYFNLFKNKHDETNMVINIDDIPSYI